MSFIPKQDKRETRSIVKQSLQRKAKTFQLTYCKYCKKRTSHSSFRCFYRPHKPLLPESEKAKQKRLAMYKEWLKHNPPDKYGYWYCYLRISPRCLYRLTKTTLEHEHVKSKSKRKDLQYDITNIRPSCSACNMLKGSQSLEKLSVIYPHLQRYIET